MGGALDWRTLPAGRELDVIVAERVMGKSVEWKTVRSVKGNRREPSGVLPHYSTGIAAAWLVVDELSARGYHVVVKSPFSPGDECHAGFTPHGVTGWNGRPDHRGSGDTAPLAIVRAALAATEAHP